MIGAFPGARGMVADLGGGSLELVSVDGGLPRGASLPLGTLRLPALRERGLRRSARRSSSEKARAGWAAAHPAPLYMVGGTWRALAAYAHAQQGPPADRSARLRARCRGGATGSRARSPASPRDWRRSRGISALRAAGLPDAAAHAADCSPSCEPEGVVFS